MFERDIWLPSIISDNMVLQAHTPAVIWGNAGPRQRVDIQIAGKHVRTAAGADGNFRAKLPPLKPGGPFTLKICARSEKIIENVLVGDVWLGSGQSNMDWSVSRSLNPEQEIAAARYPKIRLFSVAQRATIAPADDVTGRWVECSPQTVGDFSATAYFFGREIYRALRQPLGLINSSWGGTRIEPWIGLASLLRYPKFSALIKPYREYFKAGASPDADSFHKDRANLGVGLGWAAPECPASGWKKMKLPTYWTSQGIEKVGAFWFRKTVNIPALWKGEDLYLSLGAMVDFDTTYVNGTSVGGIGIETKGFWDVPRKYVVPAAVLKPGRNVIAVRVFAHNTNGGFSGPAEKMHLSVINKKNKGTLSLAGNWDYRIECALRRKGPVSRGVVPGTLFNAMIHPLLNFPIKGFLWYQGESNIDNPLAYRQLLPLLIKDWRTCWKQPGRGALPFYFAQLPDYGRPGDSLALLREAQLMTLKLPNTGMAVLIDGDENDVHPRNKQMAGRRLALQALAKTYGKKIEFSGPLFKRQRIEGSALRIEFTHCSGLTTRDKKMPAEFTIAGADRKFLAAKAKIEQETVRVWSDSVPRPKFVRYAWSSTPVCNLCNKAGLPASPFRTDVS